MGKPKWHITDQELEAQLKRAKRISDEENKIKPRGVHAWYDHVSDNIGIKLNNGLSVLIPRQFIKEIHNAPIETIKKVAISLEHEAIEWEELDIHVDIMGLILHTLNAEKWSSQYFGRLGGRSKSPGKVMAARENGKKGGRPRKTPIQIKS